MVITMSLSGFNLTTPSDPTVPPAPFLNSKQSNNQSWILALNMFSNVSTTSWKASHLLEDSGDCGEIGENCHCGCWEDAQASRRYFPTSLDGGSRSHKPRSPPQPSSSAGKTSPGKSDHDGTWSTSSTWDQDESSTTTLIDDDDNEDDPVTGTIACPNKCYKIFVLEQDEPKPQQGSDDGDEACFKIEEEGSGVRGEYLADLEVLLDHIQELTERDSQSTFRAYFLSTGIKVFGTADDVLQAINSILVSRASRDLKEEVEVNDIVAQ